MVLLLYLIISLHYSKCGNLPMCYRSMTGKNRNRQQALKKFHSNLTNPAESNNNKKHDVCILYIFFSNDSFFTVFYRSTDLQSIGIFFKWPLTTDRLISTGLKEPERKMNHLPGDLRVQRYTISDDFQFKQRLLSIEDNKCVYMSV